MLQFTGVSKRYGAQTALHTMDLTVGTGRTTVLIGPSGCGKSTLLRLVAGLARPDSGQILFEGTPLTPSSLAALRRRMGYVIQEGGLFPHLTVERNVTLMARQLRWGRPRIAGRLGALEELVRFPPGLLGRYPAELSGGQRQRVSLMRALMLDPDLLLLDEPLGALDPLIRYDLQQELGAIFERLGKTVLLVTHDLAEAAYFGHHLVLMRQGRLVQQGRPRALLEAPADPFVTRFVKAQRRSFDGLEGNA
jgi:osmoprotectant transport system ATP-binding protein